ncbi:hypothetical protein EKO27_g8925 [Xylaria grammica]|uniref:DUF7730 domain-containing protein n=1 Tax=Xylaria grammica TaxID=363999 RepID=A0A439CVL4_9PEZI|nr:hypothetical protein EKO27_g8925 [Xylaria grammica]
MLSPESFRNVADRRGSDAIYWIFRPRSDVLSGSMRSAIERFTSFTATLSGLGRNAVTQCPSLDCGVVWDSCAECRGKVDWRNMPAPGWNVLPPPDQRGTCYRVEVNSDWQPLPLLTTCRKIYTEGINILYSTNTFRFPLPAPSRGALHAQPKLIEDFSATLLPQRLEQITRVSTGIYFPQFKALNDVLAQNLPGLRYLELRARIPRGNYDTDMDPDTGALSQLVMGVRSRVTGAKVVLRADLDNGVPLRLGTQLPEELEVVMTPDKAWERSGFIFWKF